MDGKNLVLRKRGIETFVDVARRNARCAQHSPPMEHAVFGLRPPLRSIGYRVTSFPCSIRSIPIAHCRAFVQPRVRPLPNKAAISNRLEKKLPFLPLFVRG
eukprot:scaffold467_cov366-Pavlova_lutheri.AAC.12